MSLTVADLVADLGIDDHGFQSKLGSLMSRFGPFGAAGNAAVLGIGAAFVGLTAAAIHFGDQFQASFNTIRVGTGATGKALKGLEGDFNAVVKSVPTSFGDAATAIADLNTRTGATGRRLQDLAAQELKLAKITHSDLSENIQTSTRMFGDWSIATKDQSKALDEVFRASQQTGIGLGDLMQTVVAYGAPLRNLGFGFTDSIAMLSKWEKEGVNVETVLAGMRYSLKTFAKEGIDPQKGFQKAIEDITKAPSRGAAMKIGSQVFGLRGASDVVAAIREGRFSYEALSKSIANGHDTIAKAEKDTRTWHDSLTLLRNNALVALEPVLTGLVGKLGDWSAALVRSFQGGSGSRVVADAQRIFGGIAGVVSSVVRTIQRVWKTIGPSVMLVLGEVGKDLAFWGKGVEAWARQVAAIAKVIWKGWQAIAPYVEAALRPALVAIKAFAKVALDVLVVFLRVLRGDWGGAWSALKNLVSDALHGMVSVARAQVSALVTALSGLGKLALAAVSGFGSLLYNAGRALLQGLINGVKSMVSSAVSAVRDAANSVKHAVTGIFGIHSPSSLFHGYGQQLMAGLALGIGDNAGLVNRALGDVSRGLTLPQGGGSGPVPAGAGGFTVHGDVLISLESTGDASGDGAAAAEAFVRRARELAAAY